MRSTRLFFSIIIPVYNVETYLTQCLYSILQQNFNDFEVILINDGSTHNSVAICDTYVNNDDRIREFYIVKLLKKILIKR